MNRIFTDRRTIIWILILQVIPLIIYPPDIYSITNQEWWLSGMLVVCSGYAVFELVVRNNYTGWPWYLIGFSQGFNFISRLMMLLPHATMNQNGAQVFDSFYVSITVLAMVLSTLMLSYVERPDVRMALHKK